MSQEYKYEIEYEEDENYKEVITNIIKNIFGESYILTNKDYEEFDKIRNHKLVSKDKNYEVMETLGDGILKGIIIQSIIESYNNEDQPINESYISELRMLLERTEIFSYLLTKYFGEIEDYINFIQTNNPYDYEKIKEDIFEALIGCIYKIIYNYSQTHTNSNLLITLINYYKNIFIDYIKTLQTNKEQLIVNYIKQLSEYCMKNYKQQPEYKYNKINTKNGVIYEMSIKLDDHIEKCKEKTQHKAKQKCAYLMLIHLNIIKDKIISPEMDINNIIWIDNN